MNRDKALFIADRIMTRIETDKAIHKDAIADEIQAGAALDEIIDVISHDGEKWVHRDGTPLDMGDDRVDVARMVDWDALMGNNRVNWAFSDAFLEAVSERLGVQRIRLEDFKA